MLELDDVIKIYKAEVEGNKKFVSIEGYVKRPGRYELYESNMTVYDLIFKAGGLDDILHRKNMFLGRADLIRVNNNGISSSLITIDLRKVLESKG